MLTGAIPLSVGRIEEMHPGGEIKAHDQLAGKW
jgi:hypothetical protein